MKVGEFTSANRAAWDEAAPLHRSQNMEALRTSFAEPGYSCLDAVETGILQKLGVFGKDVAQLCCNNGRELLSVRNLGARRCVGFDGSAGFIEQADELAAAASIDCRFVCTDIYDIDAAHDGNFDLVTVTIGVLSWMPDLGGFFAVAERLLRPGGAMFIYEQHPILEMVKPGKAGDPLEWETSYFSDEPFVDNDGLDYYGGGAYDSKPMYSFLHKMSDVIMAGVRLGMHVEHFEERPEHNSNTWYNAAENEFQLPMNYILVFRKP